MARLQSPLVVAMSGAFGSAWACLSDSQLPARTPIRLRALRAGDASGPCRRQQPLSVATAGRVSDKRMVSQALYRQLNAWEGHDFAGCCRRAEWLSEFRQCEEARARGEFF